jgi:hypothetical protein
MASLSCGGGSGEETQLKVATFTLAAALALPLIDCTVEKKNAGPIALDGANQVHRNTAAERVQRRLEAVTWNPVTHHLTWEVSKGAKDGESYKAVTTNRYAIDMDKATMTFDGQTRGFSEDEAANVQRLMYLISKYAVDSTIWWEAGQGDPIDGSARPERRMQPERNKSSKPRKNYDHIAALNTPVK